MSPLPLDLYAEVTSASGARYRWDGNQPPGSRPQNFSFRTKIGEGFSDAGLTLARRIDLDYPDLELVNSVSMVGADGSIAYEGRIEAMPRELGDSHSISVTLAGWMAHARDRKFSEIYVDRDIGSWGPPSRGRRSTNLAANFSPVDPDTSTDQVDSVAGVSTHIDGTWSAPYIPVGEAWYDAGPGLVVTRVGYFWRRGAVNVGTAAPWTWAVLTSTDDKGTTLFSSGNLVAAGPAGGYFTPTSFTHRYAFVQMLYNGTPAGADGARFSVDWYKLAVYGTVLPTYTGEPGEPEGVYASDVIRDIARRWCPLLDTSGVQDTNYVIQHLAFKDQVDPFDAFLEVNKYHLWHIGVWENKRLVYRPYDLTDYDWEIRTDDQGTTFAPQGPSTENLFNGIVVSYTDLLTGTKNTLTPATNPELDDTSPDNPWNKQGIDHWDEVPLSTPTLQAQALQIGRAVLADRNRPKAPGTITVQGYIRDRAGNQQPAWKVRAGDTVSVTNFPNDAPRLIHETSYDDSTKTLTLSIDAPASALDALFDRIGNAFTARGLA
jgi:hypothetical protein